MICLSSTRVSVSVPDGPYPRRTLPHAQGRQQILQRKFILIVIKALRRDLIVQSVWVACACAGPVRRASCLRNRVGDCMLMETWALREVCPPLSSQAVRLRRREAKGERNGARASPRDSSYSRSWGGLHRGVGSRTEGKGKLMCTSASPLSGNFLSGPRFPQQEDRDGQQASPLGLCKDQTR